MTGQIEVYKGAIVDERQWIHAIQRGDKRYLQDITEKYYDDIFRFCAFQTGSREDAYDLAQETFLRFIRYVESYHDRNLKGYLLTIATNICKDYLRKRATEERLTVKPAEDWQWDMESMAAGGREAGGEGEAGRGWGRSHDSVLGCPGGSRRQTDASWGQPEYSDPEEQAVAADVHGRLMQALAQLPQMQREAILLHYLYDMKYREIGRMTEVPLSTVKSRVRQGMDRLQGLLRREDFLD